MKKGIFSGRGLLLLLAGLVSFIGAVRLSPGHEAPDTGGSAQAAVKPAPADLEPRVAAEPATDAVVPLEPAAPATERIATVAPQADPFGLRSWLPPPPPPPPRVAEVAPAPPPAPTAPALPFSFIGQIENSGGLPKAFLTHSESLHIVAAGDLVEKVYRVESITPTKVVLTYLPLMQEQSINLTGPAR